MMVDCALVVLDFEEKFGNVAVSTSLGLVRNFTTANVCNALRPFRTRTAQTEHNLQVVAKLFVENSRQSQRKASLELDIFRSNP